MTVSIDEHVLWHFVSFINSGGAFGWQGFWEGGGQAFVRRKARVLLTSRRSAKGFGKVDENAVEDTISTTMVTLLRIARGELQGQFRIDKNGGSPAALAAWLKKVVSSRAIDFIRSHRKTRSGINLVAVENLELNPVSRSSSRNDHGADAASRREDIVGVNACLNQLDVADQAVIRMAFVEDLPQREIARRLNISPASGHRRVRDAVERLRTSLIAARVSSCN